jgi:hypothetical protein
MHASIREYQGDPADIAEIAHRADESFADKLAQQPGFMAYELIDCGDGRVVTMSVFTNQESANASADLAAEFVRDQLAGFTLERTGARTGEVLVSRAASDVLEAVHA